MARVISIGAQSFQEMRMQDAFLVDKTAFIREWWKTLDTVTLICRPRRFGKTLTLSMVECFFSTKHAGRGEELFAGLEIWDGASPCELQGSVPTVMLSFADCKGKAYATLERSLCDELARAWRTHADEIDSSDLGQYERELLHGTRTSVDPAQAAGSLKRLCELLTRSTGQKVLVLIDEYDTPMQEAWIAGCWNQMADFVRRLFNSTLKTNPYLRRALITGITRITQESIFSDLNNVEVVTTTSDAYATAFGFTEDEVFAAMDEFGLNEREEVRRWYDGFSFGNHEHIYNPWSATSYLKKHLFKAYWANTSGNALVSSLVRVGGEELKADFEALLSGNSVRKVIDEQIVFQNLDDDDDAVWSLLLASGYVRADDARLVDGATHCTLSLTNHEVRVTFDKLVRRWFQTAKRQYGAFVNALLAGDARGMTRFLNDVALRTFSFFDSGTQPSGHVEPERFWHGFVLGLLVELRDTHQVLSNRESGWGRYDTIIVPRDTTRVATVLEFKVLDHEDDERTLADTVASALAQIEAKDYDAELSDRGFDRDRIRHFGIAFEVKRALVG